MKLSALLVRQKIIIATVLTCIMIMLLATLSYINAADRVGRDHLAPEVTRSFADVFQLQYSQQPSNTEGLQALANTLVKHFQIQEIAIYNSDKQRIIYACSKNCSQRLPQNFFAELVSQDNHLVYPLSKHNGLQVIQLVILTDVALPEFFYLDTFSTTLLVVALSTLLLLFLYARIRYWQKQPFQNMLTTIEQLQARPNQRIRFDLKDADTRQLGKKLNQLIVISENHEGVLKQEKEKAERSRLKALRLSNETRKVNEQLEQEITIRKSVENQLTHTQSFLDSIIDSMPSALFTLDQHGFIIQCNQQAAEWLAQDKRPLVGKKITHYIKQIQQFEHLLKQSLEQHITNKLERITLTLPNAFFPADIAIYPLEDLHLKGLVIRIDDITQREKMEEVMMQTEKMRSVGGLAAGMAHEINNPLGAILQSIQNVQRRLQADNDINQKIAREHKLDLTAMNGYLDQRDINKFIANIKDAGERAAVIVSNMLQFSRGSQQQLNEIKLKDLIERSLTIANADLNLQAVELEVNSVGNDETLYCIPSEIEQVILNILQNAAQALHTTNLEFKDANWQAKIQLTVSQDADNTFITIKDNGPGMSDETRRRILEPFYTTKDVGAGTGLGLPVSYFIITAHHNGQLEITTKADQGSCFTIRLPNRPMSNHNPNGMS